MSTNIISFVKPKNLLVCHRLKFSWKLHKSIGVFWVLIIYLTDFNREIARMLADDYKKRVMIVDTSNEIGGDGDIPHAGIGSARRLQVPNPDMQHKVY